ncbi:S8 family serine peptidase [Actinokineospora cianjurensis]|uniref:Subtilisin family serine protease n=1 Tax=Actinokineospora cianjurensis TaxID=585224 RepID=A0A421B4W6_9PSEU|nr:S8 family serine peptidase [Actinokineospora cianjurensis]RLK59492.1 subtilisin family serine protease [Actinokineospora cianjurensis]
MLSRKAGLAALALGAACAVAAIAVPAGAAPAVGTVVQAKEHYAGQYIVVLRDAAASGAAVEASAQSLVSTYGGTIASLYKLTARGYSVHGMTEAQAKRLAADPAVRTVYQDGKMRGNDVQTNPTWGLDRVDQRDTTLDRKYEYNATGEGVTVYSVDSGVRISHQDFEGRARSGYDFLDKDNDASDCNGHGTHTSGTAVSKTYGVAKKAKLVALRVLGCDNNGPDSLLSDAVEWITANGVKPAVVNISIGQFETGIGDEQIQASIRAGFVYAVAAGNNNGASACNYSPARVPEAITVASIDQGDRRSSFSNIGTCVDIYAPGANITSLSYSSDTGTAGNSGTSMATPHVAGAAALYLQGHPNASPADVATALTSLATPNKVTDPGTGSPNKLLYTKEITATPGPGPDPTCAKQTNADDVAIPDAGAAATSSITLSGCTGNASSTASVEVGIAHPYRGDLAVSLIAPDGTSYPLKASSAGDPAADVRATYTVNLSSEAKNGTWKLSVTDVYRFDTGTIDTWSITV